jgi:hypothetical protein
MGTVVMENLYGGMIPLWISTDAYPRGLVLRTEKNVFQGAFRYHSNTFHDGQSPYFVLAPMYKFS